MICLKWNKKRKNGREIKRMETQIKKESDDKKASKWIIWI